jgi:hypothetical protein
VSVIGRFPVLVWGPAKAACGGKHRHHNFIPLSPRTAAKQNGRGNLPATLPESLARRPKSQSSPVLLPTQARKAKSCFCTWGESRAFSDLSITPPRNIQSTVQNKKELQGAQDTAGNQPTYDSQPLTAPGQLCVLPQKMSQIHVRSPVITHHQRAGWSRTSTSADFLFSVLCI